MDVPSKVGLLLAHVRNSGRTPFLFLPAPMTHTGSTIIISTVVCCCRAVFWHPFSISFPLCPQLPVWGQHSHHHLPNHVAFELFSSRLLVYLSFCLQKFHAKVHRCFLCQIVQYLHVFIYSPENFLISNFIKSFPFLLHIHISKASNLLSVPSTSTSLLHTVLHSRPSISLFYSVLPDSFYL